MSQKVLIELNMLALSIFIAFTVSTAKVANRFVENSVWEKRALVAEKWVQEAYHPDPFEVVNHMNHHVHLAMNDEKNTRRGLSTTPCPCVAENPIDKCWRCDPLWAEHREKLVDCVLGFGRRVTGGKGGKVYVVTDPSDNEMENPVVGTLRHAVIQTEPLWIIFACDMVIRLKEELIMAGNKTIDGRGAQVHIVDGAGIMIQLVQNIIICNLHIQDIKPGKGGSIRSSLDHVGIRAASDGDGITVHGSCNVWIDHVSMSNCSDGLIDVVAGSTGVSITNSHFTRHDHVMLFGADDKYMPDEKMQVTVAFNHFGQGLVQRMPCTRLGFVHILNNDYTHWIMYAIGGSAHPTLISQGNRFVAPDNRAAKDQVTHWNTPVDPPGNWFWKSEGDLLLNGAVFKQYGDPNAKSNCPELIPPQPGEVACKLTKYSGQLSCVEKQPC